MCETSLPLYEEREINLHEKGKVQEKSFHPRSQLFVLFVNINTCVCFEWNEILPLILANFPLLEGKLFRLFPGKTFSREQENRKILQKSCFNEFPLRIRTFKDFKRNYLDLVR